MANKHLIPQKSTLFKNKLSKILENIQRARGTKDLQTKEAYTLEAVKLLAAFYRTVDQSNFLPVEVRTGTSPLAENYNNNLQQIKDDLEILFLELENVEGVVIENFNLFAAHSNRLSSRIKRLGSRVTDFALFSRLPLKNSIFFSDTFSDLSKLSPGSNLLNATECEVNQVEGILTLPVDRAGTQILQITESPLINSNSNGREGNNEEIRAGALNNNPSAMFDNNPDTWFEYERVIQEDDGVPLVLDFTVNLGDSQILNFIRINPNNFGSRTEVEIVDISTSNDGQLYVSIKDDIPITGFLVEDEENVFKLAPSTSKFAGQGLYTFTPRYAKYIRVVLRQTTPYFINTVQGQQFRYAIGIRDFEAQRIAYEAAGEAVSAPFLTTDEIKKVALQTNQTPIQASELATITHQVSFDDGNTWNDISPIKDSGFINTDTIVPEIVNINTEDINSINTENPVFSIRYKALLSRNDDGFSDSSTSFVEQVLEKTELKTVPQQQPWFVELDKKPLAGSISVIDPGFGSRDKPGVRYSVGKGTGTARAFQLPFDNLRTDLSKRQVAGNLYEVDENFIQSVFVDGKEWTRVSNFINLAGPGGSQPDDEHYMLTADNRLIFGDGINGKSPEVNANIEIAFTEERLYPVTKNDHTTSIQFPTSIDKNTVEIARRGLVLTSIVEARRDAQIHRLDHRNIVDIDNIMFSPSGQSIFTNRVEFQNGLRSPEGELTTAGDWSIDTDRGIIYSYNRVGIDETITISYKYQSEEILTTEQWDWGDDKPLHQSITIKDDAWVTNSVVGYTVASGINTITLSKLSVVEGTVNINAPDGISPELDPFVEEVPFLDGRTELHQVVKREQEIPSLTPVGPATVASFVTNAPITLDTNFAIAFDNTVLFATEVSSLGAVNATGEYYVDRSSNTITVYTGGASVSAPGKVIYWSDDPTSVPDGAYSIDYVRGNIFCQRSIPSADYIIDFEYADYIIRYNLARLVPEEDWELDATAGTFQIEGSSLTQKATISILPNEVLRKARTPSAQGGDIHRLTVYQINYKYIGSVRQDIADLAPYFSPVLKDYALQVITKGFL